MLHFKAYKPANNSLLFSYFKGQSCQYKATPVTTTQISIQVSADDTCQVHNTATNQTGGTIIISDLTPGTTYSLTINCTTECCHNFTTSKFACELFILLPTVIVLNGVLTCTLHQNKKKNVSKSAKFPAKWEDKQKSPDVL